MDKRQVAGREELGQRSINPVGGLAEQAFGAKVKSMPGTLAICFT